MSRRYDCSDPLERTKGIADAVSVIRRGELVVLPTDTVYGIGADAFTPSAVTGLLDAKGRGRDMPAPVLVGSVRAAQALVDDLGTYGQDLIDEFWPGALTIVCRANTTLAWDLGETKGTVAIRMPLHQLALELLKETGPMAVSSANRSGAAPARTAEEAETQLGDSVAVYLDNGPSGDGMPSSIVDLTGAVPRLLRAGAISEERLREVCGVLLSDEDDPAPEPAETPTDEGADAAPDGAVKAAESTQDGRSPAGDEEAKPAGPATRTAAEKDAPPADR
ncbi:L-threonylcarbamoyladenylate synthase [Actinoallomurus purpureus]|uniref:L-threonylcarbamoyladenylate synthase n=1 Tax=Actinoallomurus purpureus TaxID=478114 RepID=UPI002092DBE5|nr:L-threonylcarbamoyladenylate synthase [Actinoallomurus purpureus]MCO6006178.1 L-threonylcarbamoyladenylate synthase [Actinoallomurus purpureus]